MSNHSTYEVRLRRGIAVIELHDVRGESLTAIAAWHVTDLIEQICLCAGSFARVFDPS